LILSPLSAQKVVLKRASMQEWSGGVAGRYGYNYYLEIESKEDLVIDSIYIKGYCFSLKNSNRADDGYFWYRRENKYNVVVKQAFNKSIDHIRPHNPNEEKPVEKEKQPVCKPPELNGKALLVYYHKGKRKTLIVEAFETLPGQRYP